jgi:2-keto-4-pentenoate hydratase
MQFRAGEFVFSGTVCLPLPVEAGDRATVSFTGLGSVSAEFVE